MTNEIKEYIKNEGVFPLFIQGNALDVLKAIPDNVIDCCITSPPYWQKRQYENGGIGLESTKESYIENLYCIINEIKRTLKPTGAFWLNIGDSFVGKSLQCIPWRVAIKMIENGWILRNDIIWNKHKGRPLRN